MTSGDELQLVEGLKAYVGGNEAEALAHFREVTHLAGLIALRLEYPEDAIRYLQVAEQQHQALGSYFEKYGFHLAPNHERIVCAYRPDSAGDFAGFGRTVSGKTGLPPRSRLFAHFEGT